MPLHIQVTYDDDSVELFELPADAWRANEKTFTKGFFSDRNVVHVELDPKHAFADIDRENNVWSAPAIREGEQTSPTGS